MSEKSDIDFAYAAACTAAISAIDAYELAVTNARHARNRSAYYMAFNDVIRAARAARDALDAAYATAEENLPNRPPCGGQ